MLAFATEWMARQKELGPKSLETFLRRHGSHQTPKELYEVMKGMAARYGLKMQFRPKAKP